jgi:hypothetical protein
MLSYTYKKSGILVLQLWTCVGNVNLHIVIHDV